MSFFTATFSAVTVSAAQDVFEIVAHASSRVAICEILLGQYSDAGDAEAELVGVQVIRGYTTSGSGGDSVTPANLAPWGRAAVTTVERNNTTVAKDGTGVVLLADVMNVQAGWAYRPQYDPTNPVSDERIWLDVGDRLVVRITAPGDAVTMNGTIKFQEAGKLPTS
jgi:hypothetical protein